MVWTTPTSSGQLSKPPRPPAGPRPPRPSDPSRADGERLGNVLSPVRVLQDQTGECCVPLAPCGPCRRPSCLASASPCTTCTCCLRTSWQYPSRPWEAESQLEVELRCCSQGCRAPLRPRLPSKNRRTRQVQPLLSVPPRGTLVSRLCDSSYLVTYVELEP